MPFTGGTEFRANEFTDFTQITSSTARFAGEEERAKRSIAVDADGNIVVVWSSLGQGPEPNKIDFYEVYARRYDAATGQWGPEFLVNRNTLPPNEGDLREGNQLAAAVAIDDEGDFVITWSDNGLYASDPLGYGIYAQRYGSDGQPIGEAVQVNTNTSSDQFDSSIALDADGDYVITWTSRDQDGNGNGIYARRYSKDGTPVTAEIRVNTYTTNDQTQSAVAMDANGNFVVVWSSFGQDGSLGGIYGQRFSANGTPLGTEFRVNTGTVGEQNLPEVAMDATGNFVVTWTSNEGGTRGNEIRAQRYDSNGVAQGDVIAVNTTAPGSQTLSSVKMLATGGFIVTWTGDDASGRGIYGRRFNALGQPLAGADGEEFLINVTTTGSQNFASVGADANGNFAVAWSADQTEVDGEVEDVYVRRFSVTPSENDPPTDIRLSVNTIVENSADGTPIGTLLTTDPNDPEGNDLYTYALVSGTGATDNAAFTIVNNELRILRSPDFEAKPSYSIRVRTTDVGGLSFDKVLIVTVLNANEQPTDLALSNNTINENIPANSLVGTFSTTDPDAGNTHIYSLVAGTGATDNAAFTIVNNELRINAIPNFEAKSSYSIRVRTTDQNGLFVEKVLTVAVRDLNDAPTNINLSSSSIDENVPPNSLVGTFSTVDPDATDSFTYRFAAGTGGTDNGSFEIVGNQLLIRNSPDFETKPSYSIRVESLDKGGIPVVRVFTITVNDLNDPPTNKAPTDLSIAPSTVNENVPIDSVVGRFASVDENAGDTFRYSLVNGIGSDDNAAFEIVNDQLRIKAIPNFEAKSSYTIRVRTTDAGGLSFEKALIINVNNLNEAPTDIRLTPSSVDENVPIGTAVGQLAAIDPDAGDTFVYTLVSGTGGTDNGSFSIVGNELRLNFSPNFEAKSDYSVRVRATDRNGTGLFFEKVLLVSINDVAEAGSPTDLTLSKSDIAENSPANSVIGTLITTDNSSGPFVYELDTSFGDAANFTINASNQLVLRTIPNFEVKPSYLIRVKTTDPDGLSLSKVLTINVTNVNEPPIDLAISSTSIDENRPVNSVVGTLSTTDPDAGDTFTYTLVAGTGSTDNAAFRIVNNQLQILGVPNFEAKSSYNIRVRTTDRAGLFFEKALTITVRNVGEAPTDINLSATSIDENRPANSLVGTLSTVDGDANETFTYALVSGTGGTDNAAFAIVNNQLQIRNVPNFETKPSYSIRIRSTDKDGLTFEKVFVITVRDLNETPLDISLSATSIDENKPANSVVGTFSTIDSDANDTFTYQFVSGIGATDNAAFTIVNNELRINGIPDFETKPSYSIRIRTRDASGLTLEKVFIINVNNLSETPGSTAPTDLLLSNTRVDENRPPDFAVGTFSTIDPDQGDTFTYTLVTGSGSSDNAAFKIVNNELRLNQFPDFETKPAYSIRVRTTDSGGKTFEKVFTITVNNLSEQPGTTPPRDLLLSSSSIDENKPANSVVGTLSTIDPDAGDTFTYDLVAGAGGTDNAAFTIVNNELRINGIPDFETKPSYSVRIRTRDAGNLSIEKVFTITVNNLPEQPGTTPPRDLLLSNGAVDENKPIGTVVGTFSTIDPDQGDSFTYALVAGTGSTDNAAFTIVNNELRLNTIPDFETKSTYSIRVRTRDVGNLSIEKVFTIRVNNLPETPGTTPPRDILLSSNRIDENRPANSVVGTLSTIDPDSDEQFTYTLVTGTGSTDNAAFTIVGNQLRLTNPADFETKSNYSIRVRTSDRGNLTFEKVFTINVNDLPEQPGDTPPTDLVISRANIDENVPANSLVGTLSTVDPDRGDTFTYALVTGAGSTDNAAFTIVGDQLRIRNSPDFETKPSYSIRVATTDAGGLTFTKVLTITVNNLNDPPIVTTTTGGLVYQEGAGNVAIDPTVRVTDIDSPNLLGAAVRINGYVPGQDSLALTPPAGITASFDAATGVLTLTGAAPIATYQTALRAVTYRNSSTGPNTNTRTLEFTARDANLTSRVATRTIQIIPVDSAPVVTTSGGALAYQENAGEVAIDAGVTVVDPDSATLTGATVRISGYVRGEDFLVLTTPTGIVSNFDAATGILTLAGAASPASYQAALRSVRYLNTSNNPATTGRTVQFQVRDAGAASNLATRSIQVTAINSPPRVAVSGGELTYGENAGAVAIDPQIRVTDADSATLVGATVKLQGYIAGQDSLSVTAAAGIASNFDAATGTLTLTGNATVATYQAVLRSVAYTNRSDNPNLNDRVVQVSVRDGATTSNLATRSIKITPVNDAPVLKTSIQEAVFTRGSILVDPQLTLTDPDHARLTGATISIGNYVAGEDNLLFKDQNGITGNFDPLTGVLRLSGAGAVVSYQTALRSVRFANNRSIPTALPRTLEIQATDGITGSDRTQGRIQVNFALTDEVPAIDLNGTGVGVDYSNTFVMGGPPVAIVASDARFTNQTYPVLTSAQVQITNLLNGSEEVLLIDTTGTGIASQYDPKQGALLLSGVAPLATYLQVLRSVQYNNSSTAIDTTTRTVLFTVNNGQQTSEPAQTRVQISQIRLDDGTTGNKSLVTTPSTDLINAGDGEQTVLSTVDNLQQNDVIAGGAGRDTFMIMEGGEASLAQLTGEGRALIDLENPSTQVSGILVNSTSVTGFEVFDLTGFTRNATLTGSGQDDTLTGGRNHDLLVGKNGNDVLKGGMGDDRLDGGSGDDLLEGGLGNDFYFIDSAADLILETADAGLDTVQSTLNYRLGDHLEALILTGTATVGTGNSLNNELRGNGRANRLNGEAGNDQLWGGNGNDILKGGNGNDRLIGGAGQDRLIGGKGKDRFVLSNARKNSRDRIQDFRAVDDTIEVVRGGFSRTLKRGKIRSNQFRLGAEAVDRSDRFIYDRGSGSLFFDADGIGGTSQVLIATLSNRSLLTRSDIVVVNQ
ncbi:MAG: hypothetical protein MUF72_03915 [Elainella sp. Prado103]|nr:hypothetical protein [Elainella sp. Prado103]